MTRRPTIDYQRVSDYFDLGHVEQTPNRLIGGRLNQQWIIQTPKGHFVIKKLNPKRVKNEKALTRFIQTNTIAKHFSHYVHASYALEVGHSPLYKDQNTVYMVYPYIKGKVLEQNELTDLHTQKMAKLLATLHSTKIETPLLKERLLHAKHEDIDIIESKLLHEHPHISEQLRAIKKTLYEIITRYDSSQDFFNSDILISHCDLDVKNVVWNKDNEPVLIDWEYASQINRYVDLISSSIYWSMNQDYQVDLQKLTLFLKEYTEHTHIIPTKKQLHLGFIGMLAGWTSWLLFNLNQLKRQPVDETQHATALTQSHISFHAIPYMFQQQSSIMQSAVIALKIKNDSS